MGAPVSLPHVPSSQAVACSQEPVFPPLMGQSESTSATPFLSPGTSPANGKNKGQWPVLGISVSAAAESEDAAEPELTPPRLSPHEIRYGSQNLHGNVAEWHLHPRGSRTTGDVAAGNPEEQPVAGADCSSADTLSTHLFRRAGVSVIQRTSGSIAGSLIWPHMEGSAPPWNGPRKQRRQRGGVLTGRTPGSGSPPPGCCRGAALGKREVRLLRAGPASRTRAPPPPGSTSHRRLGRRPATLRFWPDRCELCGHGPAGSTVTVYFNPSPEDMFCSLVLGGGGPQTHGWAASPMWPTGDRARDPLVQGTMF